MTRTLLILCSLLGGAAAQGEGMPAPRVLETKDEAASMQNRIGAQVDPSLAFTDERGYPFELRQLFPGQQPVLLLLGSALLFGATFPYVARAVVESIEHVGHRVALAYTVNTVGSILGALCVGFALLPLLGLRGSFFALLSLNLLAGCALIAVAAPRPAARAAMAFSAAGFAAIWLLFPAGVFLGFATTWGEPAVRILADQVEEASNGSIRRSLVLYTICIGVAVWVGLGMLRIGHAEEERYGVRGGGREIRGIDLQRVHLALGTVESGFNRQRSTVKMLFEFRNERDFAE